VIPILGLNIISMDQILRDRGTKELVGAGYGIADGGALPNELQFASIPIGSLTCAMGRFAESVCAPYDEFVLSDGLFVDSERLADSCKGDSGAPIFYKPPNEMQLSDGRQIKNPKSIFLVGITSRGLHGVRHSTNSLCGGGGIYTSIARPEVVNWLQSFGVKTFTMFNNRAEITQ
jgi:hypothetical protein